MARPAGEYLRDSKFSVAMDLFRISRHAPLVKKITERAGGRDFFVTIYTLSGREEARRCYILI